MRQPTPYTGIIKKLQLQANAPIEGVDAPVARAPIGYGVFAQGLAGALQQDAADPYYGAGAEAKLDRLADQERASVAATTDADRSYNLFKTLLEHPELAKDARTLSRVNDPYGLFNPVTTMADAAIDRRGAVAEGQKTTAEALNQGRQAGITVDEPTVETLFSNPITGEAATGYGLFANNRTPDEQAKLTTADAAMKKADADMIDSTNPLKYNRKSGGSAASDAGKVSFIMPIAGGGMATVKDTGSVDDVVDRALNSRRTAPIQEKVALAKKHNYHYRDTADGGLIVTNGRGGSMTFDTQGNRVK